MNRGRLRAAAAIVSGATLVALGAGALGGITGVTSLENRTLDWRQATTIESFQEGRGTRPAEVVLVLFDAFSVTDPELGWAWEQPFPRSHLAQVIDAVAGAGARTIGLDVYLELLYPRLNAIDGGDDLLRDAIQRAGNVILAAPVVQAEGGPRVGQPHPHFAEVAAGIGAAELPTAFETVREGSIAVRDGEGIAPSLALAVYLHARGLDPDSLSEASRAQGRVRLAGLPPALGAVPAGWLDGTAAAEDVLIPFPLRYHGPPSSTRAEDPPGTFPAVPSSTVDLAALLAPELFRDRIVLIGTGFHDSDKFRTPFFDLLPAADPGREGALLPYGYMFGVEVHANAVQNFLDGEFVSEPAPGWEISALALLALAATVLTFSLGVSWGALATAGILLLWGAAAFWLWAGKLYLPGGVSLPLGASLLWLPVVTPVLSGVLGWIGTVSFLSIIEGREKRFIRSAFGKYVSPEVVAEISSRPELLQLGGEKRELSLLFSDLAGFTTMSERMDPQELITHLNDYLQAMTRIVIAEQGTLDKYIGDAIMAFWNAPKALPDHATRALRTAVLMQRAMDRLNARWREEDPDAEPLVVRIGINTGVVVVGNVGGEERFDYSAIGDAVNLAARLEPANKSYDTKVIASEFTIRLVKTEDFRLRRLDRVAVKGKVEPVWIFEVMETADGPFPDHRNRMVQEYEAGLEHYAARRWSEARSSFERALEFDPSDGPSALYRERTLRFQETPPPDDWDMVERRTSK